MSDAAQGNDDFFQVASNTKNSSGARVKRVYIGGLPKNVPTLEKDLTDWMQSQVPNLTISSITINKGGKNPHAFVDCGKFVKQVVSKLHQQSFQGRKLTVQREKQRNNNKTGANEDGKQQFGGWSKPKKPQFKPISVEEASNNIESVVSEEMKQAEDAGEDTVNVAIAATTAATFLAAMNGIADPDFGAELGYAVNTEDQEKAAEDNVFQLKAMSDLLADFGQADPNWQKQRVEETTEEVGSSDSRLAQKGKAPIHIILHSFGFQNGAPKRPDGWSYSQPLAVIDCRDQFEPVPGYMIWRTGLSGAVKRVLQQENPDMQNYARTTLADQVWDCLLEAQKNGGCGYASPLEMTIYIGSETGKHRSVVLCEWAATGVRKKLRANENGCILSSVSVETRHREIVRRKDQSNGKPQQKKKHDFAGDW